MISWANFKRENNNLPNGLSLLRAVLGVILPFLLIPKSPAIHLIAGVIFIFAAITDYLDGWFARRYGLESNFGKILDPTSDKILILAPLAMFASMDFFSKWWLVPIFLREIIITFCRIGWLLEGKAAGAEKLGKIKLVFQVALTAAAFGELLCLDFSIPAGFAVWVVRATYFLLITTNVLTIISGITFIGTNKRLFGSPEFCKFVGACGVGLLPGPTGTWGSLLALFMIPLLAWNPYLYWGVFLFLLWAGYAAVSRLDLSADHDPHFIVMDEVLGMFVTFTLVPLHPLSLFLGFFLFRIFDIVKPFPCRRLEKLPGFWGITMDDIGAGIYACIALHFLHVLL
jgi:CDP-diacylglycerol--glycerol-3-phosphate 3-phosphatidyltransferase